MTFYKNIKENDILICLKDDTWRPIPSKKSFRFRKGQGYKILCLTDKMVTLRGENNRLVTFQIGSNMSGDFCPYNILNIALRKTKLEKLQNK